MEHILHRQEEMLDYNKDINMKKRNRKIIINNLIMQASVGVYETEKQNSRFVQSDVIEGMTAFVEKRQPEYKNTLDE